MGLKQNVIEKETAWVWLISWPLSTSKSKFFIIFRKTVLILTYLTWKFCQIFVCIKVSILSGPQKKSSSVPNIGAGWNCLAPLHSKINIHRCRLEFLFHFKKISVERPCKVQFIFRITKWRGLFWNPILDPAGTINPNLDPDLTGTLRKISHIESSLYCYKVFNSTYETFFEK